jgi:hypothetical protein
MAAFAMGFVTLRNVAMLDAILMILVMGSVGQVLQAVVPRITVEMPGDESAWWRPYECQ